MEPMQSYALFQMRGTEEARRERLEQYFVDRDHVRRVRRERIRRLRRRFADRRAPEPTPTTLAAL